MLTSGDVVDVDLGVPVGREAGFRHPAVVVTAQRVLDARPNVIHVVPLTSTMRGFASEVEIDADVANGLTRRSSAQCQHIRAVAASRADAVRGNVGRGALAQLRELLGLLLDIP
jgi:mRNA interferase MazF